MTWPPQSPDLNPLEMGWDELDRRVKEKQPTSAQHMWELLQDCWKSILICLTFCYYMIPFLLFLSFDVFQQYNIENSKNKGKHLNE